MPSVQQTTEQKRAAEAWKVIGEVRREAAYKSEYTALVRQLPSYVLTNGLGPTLAFLRSRGKGKGTGHHDAVYRHLSNWVMERMGQPGTDLLEWILKTDSARYRRATAETLAFVHWLKRFAEAEFGDEEVGSAAARTR